MAGLKNYFSNDYILGNIIPSCEWILKILKSIFKSIWEAIKALTIYFIKSLDNYYIAEDIVPCVKKIISLSKVLFNFIRLKKTDLFLYLKYFFKNYQLNKQRKVKEDGINIEKFSNISRMFHETKFGIKDTDYGAVKIDWDLFAKFRNKRVKLQEHIEKKHRHISIQSTFSYETKERITYN